MVNLDFLSKNLTRIITELINQQNIAKYLNYDVANPLAQPDLVLPAKDLVLNKVHPYPADPVALTKDCTQIRVYYPKSDFEVDSVIGNVEVYFDIVCAKSTLWLINDGTDSLIRPYMIVKEIMEHFNRNSIGTIGQLKFDGFVHLTINDKFDAIRLVALMTLMGDK
jgi:hypothetical protein